MVQFCSTMWVVVLFVVTVGASNPAFPLCQKPGKCGVNEYWETCPIGCPSEYCGSHWNKILCPPPKCLPPACRCRKGYLRDDKTKKCVPEKQCYAQPSCGYNEKSVTCRIICPPQSCNLPYTTYLCTEESQKTCERGCDCIEDHFRNSSGICVPSEECEGPPIIDEPTDKPDPICGKNEQYVPCKRNCPPEVCEALYVSYLCANPDPDVCDPGCMCKDQHLRNSNGTCIPVEECPPPPWMIETTMRPEPICKDPNEIYVDCEQPLPPKCPPNQNCSTDYIIPPPCNPCQCKPNYVRNDDGKCVLKDVSPCGGNQTIVPCTFKCPNQFCPVGDGHIKIACKPPRDCPSGCGCKLGYLYKSSKNLTCILAEECPAQKCRPDEVWNRCPHCLAESCSDANLPQTGVCNELVHNCQPQCVCQKEYYRNDSDICVPKSKCPGQCGVNETMVDCTFKCPHQFCPIGDGEEQYACKPPRDCPSGCGCKLGYRYISFDDQRCILAEDCPAQNCTKPHEVWGRCPSCLAESCADSDIPSTGVCNELVHNCQPKCICKKGYFRNETNICVPKSKCKTCKENEIYVPCKAGCPTDYCPTTDNDYLIACSPPYPCPGGCVCKSNYKRRSYDDPSCIPVTDCPPVNCTRPNQVFSYCPSPCLLEDCEDARRPVKNCDQDYCQPPRCICADGHFKDANGTCVPEADCPPPSSSDQPLTT